MVKEAHLFNSRRRFSLNGLKTMPFSWQLQLCSSTPTRYMKDAGYFGHINKEREKKEKEKKVVLTFPIATAAAPAEDPTTLPDNFRLSGVVLLRLWPGYAAPPALDCDISSAPLSLSGPLYLCVCVCLCLSLSRSLSLAWKAFVERVVVFLSSVLNHP